MIKFLKDINNEKDYKRVIESDINLGNNPKRSTIEALLMANGGLPEFDVTFFLTDPNDHNMQVTYIKDLDNYFYTSLVMAQDAVQVSHFYTFAGNLTNNPSDANLSTILQDTPPGVNLVEDTDNHRFLVIYDGTEYLYKKLSISS